MVFGFLSIKEFWIYVCSNEFKCMFIRVFDLYQIDNHLPPASVRPNKQFQIVKCYEMLKSSTEKVFGQTDSHVLASLVATFKTVVPCMSVVELRHDAMWIQRLPRGFLPVFTVVVGSEAVLKLENPLRTHLWAE